MLNWLFSLRFGQYWNLFRKIMIAVLLKKTSYQRGSIKRKNFRQIVRVSTVVHTLVSISKISLPHYAASVVGLKPPAAALGHRNQEQPPPMQGLNRAAWISRLVRMGRGTAPNPPALPRLQRAGEETRGRALRLGRRLLHLMTSPLCRRGAAPAGASPSSLREARKDRIGRRHVRQPP